MIVLILLLLFLTVMYGLYYYIFCFPTKKRPEAHHIPDSIFYKDHKNKMMEGVKDMEMTPFEEVSIISIDGYRLYGKLYQMQKDAPIMIFFHGYQGISDWDGYGFFRICKNNGINILMVDERTHGKSEGNNITFGIRERQDCKLWTEYIVNRFGIDIPVFLAGVSMGAASIIMASELGLPQNVKAILADCGYSEPASIIKETVRSMKLPVKPVYFFIRLGAYIFGRFNLEEATPLEAVKKLQIPILFIQGKQDSVVPFAMHNELYEYCTAPKDRVIIEGADHANSAMTDYENYEKAVVGFLKRTEVLYGKKN